MEKQNKRRSKRVKKLVIASTLIAIVLSVSTYAWFIGMQTVHVSSFDVEIASTDSLLLSLDGATWDTTVAISESTLATVSYVGHTNYWGGSGLLPMSSIGELDSTVSRMKIFEKASLTATPGGYRLLSTQYITGLNTLDEEAIYLTVDSEVVVGAAGVADTGIENSVRVAFAQIGRVVATTTDAAIITGITCSDGGTVTGICRTAQIWEPNDTNHESNAIGWYETACTERTAEDVTDPASYSGTCGTIVDGLAYPTYSVKEDIASSDNVDVYDGLEYNKYVATTELEAYDYFTDTQKLYRGVNRPAFMTFAPNSITKVRIYIYIEGQDIDNYDFASIGKQIAVKFGFTKERFTEADIDYNGPDLNQGEGPSAADKTAPVITLLGDNPTNIALDGTYSEAGATADDNVDGDITASIETLGTVDTTVAGTYTVVYRVVDAAGNMGTKTRTVIVSN